jgi:hypothetical protein
MWFAFYIVMSVGVETCHGFFACRAARHCSGPCQLVLMFWLSLLFALQLACRHQLLESGPVLDAVTLVVLRCLLRRSVVSVLLAWFIFGGGGFVLQESGIQQLLLEILLARHDLGSFASACYRILLPGCHVMVFAAHIRVGILSFHVACTEFQFGHRGALTSTLAFSHVAPIVLDQHICHHLTAWLFSWCCFLHLRFAPCRLPLRFISLSYVDGFGRCAIVFVLVLDFVAALFSRRFFLAQFPSAKET